MINLSKGIDMSFFNLKLRRKSEDILILAIPVYSRIIILLFAAAVASTFIMEPDFSFFPFLIAVLLLLSASYKETWIFDKASKKVTYGFGLIFLYKKTIVPFNYIEEFSIEGFVKGSLTKKPSETDEKRKKLFETELYRLSLRNNNFGELVINTVKKRDLERLQIDAREIATLCNSKLVKS